MPGPIWSLNGVKYHLNAIDRDGHHVRRLPNEQIAQEQTEDGASLTSLKHYRAINFPNLMDGFGRDRIDTDSASNPKEFRHFWDST